MIFPNQVSFENCKEVYVIFSAGCIVKSCKWIPFQDFSDIFV